MPDQRISTWGSVETASWRFGDGDWITVSGATVVAVNERVTTGDRPPTLSTARMTNVCASFATMRMPAGDRGSGGVVAGSVSVSSCSTVAVHVVSPSTGGSTA